MSHHFVRAVREAFRFLQDDGFSELEASETLVTYERHDLVVDIYVGRRSGELGTGITRSGTRYSLSEIIRASDPAPSDAYRSFVPRAADQLAVGLQQLASLLKRYGSAALAGDTKFYARLDGLGKEWSEQYALDVLADQLRPKAAAAFRQGDYAAAAALYGKIRARLSAAELKKLAIAESRCKE